MFTLVNAAGNVQKIAKDARKRDELIRQGYVEILPEGEESEQEEEPKEEHEPEPEVKPAKAPRKKTDDKE